MATYSLRRFSRPEVLATIAPQFLLDLLRPYAAFFARRGLTPAPPLNLRLLADVLLKPDADTPEDLANALYYIHEMTSYDAMDKLLAVFTLGRLAVGRLELAPADVAVRAWVLDRPLMERTHAELFASRPRRFEYFQSRSPVPLAPPDEAALRPLEAAMDQEFQDRNRGRGLRVFAYPHERECAFLIRHGDPYRREGTLQDGEASSVLYRPLRFDVAVYDQRGGALRVHAGSDWETSLYRGMFGKHLFGAMDHFPDVARYSLEPLRTLGKASLECPETPQIKYVALRHVKFSWGGPYGKTEVRRAKDLFAALTHRSGALPERPAIARAGFDVHFYGRRRPCALSLAPPNIAHYGREEDSDVVDRWLLSRGFIQSNGAKGAHDETGGLLAGDGGGSWAAGRAGGMAPGAG